MIGITEKDQFLFLGFIVIRLLAMVPKTSSVGSLLFIVNDINAYSATSIIQTMIVQTPQ